MTQEERRRAGHPGLARSVVLAVVGVLVIALLMLDEGDPEAAPDVMADLEAPAVASPAPHDALEPASAAAARPLEAAPVELVNEDELRFVMIPCGDHPPATWTVTLSDAAGEEVGQRSVGPEQPASFYELDADAAYGVDLRLHGSWLGHGSVSGAGAHHVVRCAVLPHVRGVVVGLADPASVELRVEAPGAPSVQVGEDGGFVAGPVSPSALIWVSGGGATSEALAFAPGVREHFVRLECRPASRVVGRVVDDRGRPVAAHVVLSSRGGREHAALAKVDGRFEIDGFDGFPAHVFAREGTRLSRALVVEHGEAPIELTLGEGGRVSGVVVREDGEAYFDGHVTASELGRDGALRALDVQRGAGGAFSVGPFTPGARVVFSDLRSPGWAPTVRVGDGDVRLMVPRPREHRLQVAVTSTDPAIPFAPARATWFAAFGADPFEPELLHPLAVTVDESGMGQAVVRAPPGGEHRLAIELRQPGWTAARGQVEPFDDPAGEFDLRVGLQVAPMASCVLTVHRPDDRPVQEGAAELRWEQPFDRASWLSRSPLRSRPGRDGEPAQAWLSLAVDPAGQVAIEHEVVAPATLRLTAPGCFPEVRELPHPLPRALDVLLTPVPPIAW